MRGIVCGLTFCVVPLNPKLASIEPRSSKIGAPTQRARPICSPPLVKGMGADLFQFLEKTGHGTEGFWSSLFHAARIRARAYEKLLATPVATGRANSFCYNLAAPRRVFASVRKWWNWQTHHLEGVAPKGVGVQIPPSAPILIL
jgi:hypothetical protein